jgi:peptidoglycan/xylan/chitin deacetylase (PgdA/CDA1 family)
MLACSSIEDAMTDNTLISQPLEIQLPYNAIMDRPRVTLPGGARVALWIAPNVEHYEYLPAELGPRDPWPRMPHPDVLNWGLRDYGNRVGLWRLFDVLDRHNVRCTVSQNMSVLKMYPEIAEAMIGRNWDFMSHGLYNSRYHWDYSIEKERAEIRLSCDIHREVTGRKLPGWFCPGGSYTKNTLELCAEAGIDFVADLYHDDQPVRVNVQSGDLWAMPYSMTLNDFIVQRSGGEGVDFAQAMIDHFDTVYREGGDQPRVMCIALHPFWIGQPHRIRHFQRALDYIMGHSDVWLATAPEILDHWRAQEIAA